MKTYVNFTRFQILLYYFACFVGMAPFSVDDNILRPVGFLRKAYAVILAILIVVSISFLGFEHRVQGVVITFLSQFTFMMMTTLYIGNLCLTVFVFAFKSNKIIEIWNKISTIKFKLRKLGVADCGKNCKKLYAKIIATNSVIFLLRIIIDNASHDHHDYSTAFLTSYRIVDIILSIHSHCASLIFVETMIYISKLFESLNNKLQGNVRMDRKFPSSDEQQNSSTLRMGRNRRIADHAGHRITTQFINIQLSVEDLEKIRELHRELCDVVESTTNFHTILILFTGVRHFINLLSNCYTAYTHIFILYDLFETPEAVHLFCQQRVAGMMIPILELFLIAHACTSVSREGNATKVVLHEVWNKFYPEKLRDELYKFSLQLLHKPVAVSAFGFFDLGYSYLYKTFCAVIAYLIIMIQLDQSSQNPGT